jgi:hypothetical protein
VLKVAAVACSISANEHTEYAGGGTAYNIAEIKEVAPAMKQVTESVKDGGSNAATSEVTTHLLEYLSSPETGELPTR